MHDSALDDLHKEFAWHISLEQWWNHRLRLLLTTMGIALGVAVCFAIRTANIIG